jgi:uncharacterized protein
MQIYLPIAEMSVPAELILGLGAVVGFLSAVFGIGGGFLATPFLIFLGIPPSIAVATQANQLVAASLTSSLGHWRRGNVDVKLGATMFGGSALGSLIGVMIFGFLRHIGQIDTVINLLYVGVLGSIGVMMFLESLRTLRHSPSADARPLPSWWVDFVAKLPAQRVYPKSKLRISLLVPLAIGFLGGLMVSLMGIGGGFFLVPAMIYLLGMSTLLAVGTSLFQILLTTALTTLLHATATTSVDLVLAVLLILGGVVGVKLGLRASPYIKGARARMILSVMLLSVCLYLAQKLFLTPPDLYTIEVR